MENLKKVCKNLGIKNYSKLRKNDLEDLIIKHCAAIKIQRNFRNKLIDNNNCPISLEKIRYPCFPISSNKKFIYYNLKELCDYLICSGNFKDPIFQTELTLSQIENIQSLSKNKKIMDAFLNKQQYEKQKKKESDILNYERIIDSLYIEIINIIDSNNIDSYFLLNSCIKNLLSYLNMLNQKSNESYSYTINKILENILIKTSKENYNYIQLDQILGLLQILFEKNNKESNLQIFNNIENTLFKTSKDNYTNEQLILLNNFVYLLIQMREKYS